MSSHIASTERDAGQSAGRLPSSPDLASPIDFATFSPADETAANIGSALRRAEHALAASGPRVQAAKAQRDALLLDGASKALTAAEAVLAQARGDAERVEAVMPGLRARLVAASAKEADAAVNEARAAGEAAAAAFNARRAVLFAAIREGAADLQRLLSEFREADAGYARAVAHQREGQGNAHTGFRVTLDSFLHVGGARVAAGFMTEMQAVEFLVRVDRERAA